MSIHTGSHIAAAEGFAGPMQRGSTWGWRFVSNHTGSHREAWPTGAAAVPVPNARKANRKAVMVKRCAFMLGNLGRRT
jgi:hypothetical protein